MLAAGTSRVDITPPVGIAHAGWGAQSHEGAEGIDMPLTITALVIEPDGNTDPAVRITILDIDTCILIEQYDMPIRDAVTTETGIPAHNQRIFVHPLPLGPNRRTRLDRRGRRDGPAVVCFDGPGLGAGSRRGNRENHAGAGRFGLGNLQDQHQPAPG